MTDGPADGGPQYRPHDNVAEPMVVAVNPLAPGKKRHCVQTAGNIRIIDPFCQNRGHGKGRRGMPGRQ